jgi:predicted RNA-binding Zn-ribbon protein involved in translation (DUF1610 family)
MRGPSAAFRRSAADFTPEIEEQLLTDEAERCKRDKTVVKYCPACGRKPEYRPDKAGRHVYSLKCEKCQAAFVIHVNE